MMQSSLKNMESERKAASRKVWLETSFQCLKQFVTHLESHASLGLNEDEVRMLQRAQSAIAAVEANAPCE